MRRAPGSLLAFIASALLLAGLVAGAQHEAAALVSSRLAVTQGGIGFQTPVAPNATAIVGDSRSVTTFDFTTTAVQKSGGAFLDWVNIRNKANLNFTADYAWSGYTAAQVRATLPAAIATKPAFVTTLAGVNSIAIGLDAPTIFADLKWMYDYAIARGVRPILFPDWGSNSLSAPQMTVWQALNALIIDYASSHPQAILVDLRSTLLTDPNAAGFKAGLSYDGTHLNQAGAFLAATYMNSVLAPYYPAPASYAMPAGQLLTNADFATATGGSVGTGNLGTLPLNFTGSRDNANIVGTFSLNTRGDGDKEIVAAINASANVAGTIGGIRLSQSFPTTGFNIGDKVQGAAQIDLDAGYTSISDLRVEVSVTYGDSTFIIGYDYEVSGTYGGLADGGGALTLTVKTWPILITKTLGSFSFRFGARHIGPGSSTVRFRRPYAIKVSELDRPAAANDNADPGLRNAA